MSQRIVIETHGGPNCPNCGGTGWLGEYEHVDAYTGEHLGNQLVPCEGGSKAYPVWDEMVEKGAVALGNRRDGWKYDDPEWWRNDMRDDARAVLIAALGLEET